jgi:predicted O-linked N-acetylglucosamine transferase (SPINDLY family)
MPQAPIDSALFSRAEALSAAGDHAGAERAYREMLRSSPHHAGLLHRVALACWHQQRADEAIEALRLAVAEEPHGVEAAMDLGLMLSATRRFEEAALVFERAHQARPGSAAPLISLGNALRSRGDLAEAIEAYERATVAEPGNADAHHILGSALGRHGFRERARAHYLEALRLEPRDPVVHSSLLYLMGYDSSVEAAVRLNEHAWWDRLHGRGLARVASHANRRDPGRKLRVGYVSADFRTHAAARFTLPIYEAHARDEVVVHSYAHMNRFDAVSERFRALSDMWRVTFGLADKDFADLIRSDEIDVLVDLGGHTSGNCLPMLALEPAPVQVSYLGYAHTTGLKAIRYRITDAVMDPPHERSFYSEELVRLPGAWCCWDPAPSPEVAPPPCLASGLVTFGGMHNLLKITDEVLDLWSRVLRAVDRSRLKLYRNTFNDLVRDELHGKLAARGISPERVDMIAAPEDGVSHLRDYADIDVCLDTQPWSGHTSTCESLWMGVPMLTLRGARAAGRQSASVLVATGLEHLIAETEDQFVDMAVKLAGDPTKLAALRASLRAQVERSPLCDRKTFTKQLEAAYRNLWRRWCGE